MSKACTPIDLAWQGRDTRCGSTRYFFFCCFSNIAAVLLALLLWMVCAGTASANTTLPEASTAEASTGKALSRQDFLDQATQASRSEQALETLADGRVTPVFVNPVMATTFSAANS